MDRASCDKTAFVSPAGQFHITVMPFGLSGAPSTFQQMIDLLTEDTNDFAATYLDDLPYTRKISRYVYFAVSQSIRIFAF